MHPKAFIETVHESDEGEKHLVLNFGPQHPATHGTLRLVLKLDGERIVECCPEIGYLHTGFEKLAEHLSYPQFITLTDRMNYMSAISNNIGFAVAVEELLGMEVPPRGQVLRVILAELTRIADHIISIGLQAMDMGAFSVMLWSFQEREKIYDIIEACCGSRLTTSYTRIGGLMRDAPADFADQVKLFCDRFPANFNDIEGILTKNRIYLDRVRGAGAMSREEAIEWSLCGPVLRACGVAHDIRRSRPYCGYEDYDFEVITHTDGDAYARWRVRADEIRESLKIIRQGLDRLPPGPVNLPNRKQALPGKRDVYTDMESMIHHFELVMWGHGFRPPKEGEIYSCTEAPNGELGYYIVTDGSPNPSRVRVRPPSFLNYAALPTMIRDHLISDAIACLSSLNVIAGELDR